MKQPNAKKAVILLSGGLDSTTTLAYAKRDGFELYALSFHYGQRHRCELDAATLLAYRYGVADHRIMTIPSFGGSALTDAIDVPKHRSATEIAGGVPITFVPGRNLIFLSFAFAWAGTLGAEDIFLGVNALDYSGYPDCRPEFVEAFERAGNIGVLGGESRRAIAIRAPLQNMTKKDIVTLGRSLGVDYEDTVSCYDPTGRLQNIRACGACDACILRRKGFHEAGVADPTKYVEHAA